MFGVITIWLILFGSKLLILEVVDVVFGDHVELGGLIAIIVLVIMMMIASTLMQKAYDRLGATIGDGQPAA